MISIIIPNYNRAGMLPHTLQSTINQSYIDWEVLIIDDGSTDGSFEKIKPLIDKEHRIKWINRNLPPKGASTCRNIGLKYAQGKYIIFLDSDDLLASHCLEQRITIMDENPELDFAVFPMLIFSKKPGDTNLLWNRQTEEPDLNRFLRLDSVWQTTGPIWRKSTFEKIGGFDESLACWQDVDIHLKALFAGLNYKVFEDLPPDAYYRKHQEGSISQNTLNSHEKIESRLKLFNQTYRQLKDINAGPDAYQAIKEMLTGILISMGTTLQLDWLCRTIRAPHIRTFLNSKEMQMVLSHGLLYKTRLYKFRPLLKHHLQQLDKHFSPNVGKYTY